MPILESCRLRLSPWGKFWCSSFWWAGGFSAASLVVLLFGKSLGMSRVYSDPETHQPFTRLHSFAILGGYFVLLFAIANWPVRRSNVA